MNDAAARQLHRARQLADDFLAFRRERRGGGMAGLHAGTATSTNPAARFARTLGPAPLTADSNVVTQTLRDRLDSATVEEVLERAAPLPEFAELYMTAERFRTEPFLPLCWGMWCGVEAVAAQTGLLLDQPPPDVHAMARGPLAAAGGLYEADLVTAALLSAGAEIPHDGAALDFGCSSGRVVRVLKAAYPDVQWQGCDPNAGAIAWARDHLPGINFFVNAQQPPAGVGYGTLDLVYAISIWSHFAPELGLRWFDEMHRLLRPGGHLVMTTHGLQAIAFYVEHGLRSPQQSQEIERALYADGYWYAAEFGTQGDWGVVNPAWGTCFLSPEWVIAKLCPLWRVLEFAPGRNQENQDVYVLQRV